MIKRKVWITTSFDGLHKWENAPREVYFLRYPHRHIFHVRVVIDVEHNDREIEFLTLKNQVDQFIANNISVKSDVGSCEEIAKEILKFVRSVYDRPIAVEVSEDGENGARIEYE